MIRNYFKIAWRSIRKDPLFSMIKICGFSVGIAACLLITLFIANELSYDQIRADALKKDYLALGRTSRWDNIGIFNYFNRNICY